MEPLVIVGAISVSYCAYLALIDAIRDREKERKQDLPLFNVETVLNGLRSETAQLKGKWYHWANRNNHVTRLHQAIDSMIRLSGPYLLMRQPLPVLVTDRNWQARSGGVMTSLNNRHAAYQRTEHGG